MNKVMVDVDNILYPFYEILFFYLKKENEKIPDWLNWYEWDFYRKFGMNDKTFFRIVNEIHSSQELNYKSFPYTKEMLDVLHEKFYVLIASHRSKKTLPILKEWLDSNDLFYDQISLTFNKTKLFDSVSMVIDDSPVIIQKAVEKSIPVLTISYSWNKHLKNLNNVYFFNSIKEIYEFLKGEGFNGVYSKI